MTKRITILIMLILSTSLSIVLAQEDNIEDNPDHFIGESVTVEGVANVVSPNAFELTQTQSADVTPDSILVFPAGGSDFAIDINTGMHVRVTGTFNAFEILTMEAMLGYDLDNDALTDFDSNDYAITALTVTEMQPADPAMSNPNSWWMDGVTVTDFEADPAIYFDRNMTVEGIANIVSPNVFELTQTEPVNLSPETILVVPGDGADFAIDINNGMRVQVSGRFEPYELGALETDLGVDLDDEALVDYDSSDYAIIADSVVQLSTVDYLEAATTLDSVTDNPEAVIGETVTVAGFVDEDINTEQGNFVIREDDMLGNDRALVLSVGDQPGTDMMLDFSVNDRVVVTGTVRRFAIDDLQSDIGYVLDRDLYGMFGTLSVILATSVEHAAESDALVEDSTEVVVADGTSFDPNTYNDYPVSDASLDDVIDNPPAYYGQVVNVNGTVSGVETNRRGFYIWDDDLIDADRALVLGGSQSIWDAVGTLERDDSVAVRGVVRPMNVSDLESELGYDLNDTTAQDVEAMGLPVIVALEVIPDVEQ